jgi:hypothetical protein
MSSELKAATARANGARSRGPKTAETREISSKNALQHGLAGRRLILLECEDPGQFSEMLEEYHATYQPVNAVERGLVDEMFSARWRGDRIAAIVTCLLDMEIRCQDPLLLPPSDDPAQPLTAAFKSLADDSRALALALRYETRMRRQHERAFATLRDLQRERKTCPSPETSPAPAPLDGGGEPRTAPPLSELSVARSSVKPTARSHRSHPRRILEFPFEPSASCQVRPNRSLLRRNNAC